MIDGGEVYEERILPAAYSACVKLKNADEDCSDIPTFVAYMTLQMSLNLT